MTVAAVGDPTRRGLLRPDGVSGCWNSQLDRLQPDEETDYRPNQPNLGRFRGKNKDGEDAPATIPLPARRKKPDPILSAGWFDLD